MVKIHFSFKKIAQVVAKLSKNLPPNAKHKVYFDNWPTTLDLLMHSDPECENEGRNTIITKIGFDQNINLDAWSHHPLSVTAFRSKLQFSKVGYYIRKNFSLLLETEDDRPNEDDSPKHYINTLLNHVSIKGLKYGREFLRCL